jgi:hypothetical protein
MRTALRRRVRVGPGAGALAMDNSDVWVARSRAGTVTRVTATGRTALRVGDTPVGLAAGFGRVWIALRDADRVVSVDARTLALRSATTVGLPVSVVTGPSGVWALSLDAGALYLVDPTSGVAGAPVYAPVEGPSDMVAVGDELWLLGANDQGLSPVNARLHRVLRSGFRLSGRSLSGLSSSDGVLWVAEPGRHAVVRVEAADVAARELTAPGGMRPATTAVGACGVWVADSSGLLALLDPKTGAVISPPRRIGRSVAALAPSGTGVWVSDPVGGAIVSVQAVPTGG